MFAAFGDQPLAEFGVVAGRESHLDAGGGGELVEHGLDAVVPSGVDGDRARRCVVEGPVDCGGALVAPAGPDEHRRRPGHHSPDVLHAVDS